MGTNLAETAPDAIGQVVEQLTRSLAASGPAQQPTGWQLCAAILDALRRPGGPQGIGNWVIEDWNDQENEVSVFIGPKGGAKYEVYLTHLMGQTHNNDVLIGYLSKELGIDPEYLKRLAGIIEIPLNPPAIMNPDGDAVYLWMPTLKHYISSDWGSTLDMATLRQGSDWEYSTVVTWK